VGGGGGGGGGSERKWRIEGRGQGGRGWGGAKSRGKREVCGGEERRGEIGVW